MHSTIGGALPRSLDETPRCLTCGDELHPERAQKYPYCTKRACQEENAKGLTIVSVGVNKSADQYQILDERARAEAANGDFHDPRRGTYGTRPAKTSPRTKAAPEKPAPEKRAPDQKAAPRQSAPAAPSQPATKPAVRRAPRRWTKSQENLAVLYNEQGIRPDQIARKLGVSTYTVTQMILAGRRARGRY